MEMNYRGRYLLDKTKIMLQRFADVVEYIQISSSTSLFLFKDRSGGCSNDLYPHIMENWRCAIGVEVEHRGLLSGSGITKT
jgi:hypothetical protein